MDFFGDYVQTNTEEDIIAKTLIWTAGIEGSPIPGLKKDCMAPGNRIATDEFNRVVNYDSIFAIGDVAAMISETTPKGHPMVAPVAIQQGKLLAKNLRLLEQNKPMQPFLYKDKGSMATVGKNKAVVEIKKLKLKGLIAWITWMLVHLMSLVGFRNKFITLFHWVRNYFKDDKTMRTIITPFVLSDAKRKRRKQMEDNRKQESR